MTDLISLYDRVYFWDKTEAQNYNPLSEELPEWYQSTFEVVESMITSGETYWEHQDFYRDIESVFSRWLYRCQFIKARMVAQWLVLTVPKEEQYFKTTSILSAIAQNRFIDLVDFDFYTHNPPHSRWPHSHRYYLKTLQWNMARVAMHIEEEGYLWATSQVRAKELRVLVQ